MSKKKILITGQPHSGKSALVNTLLVNTPHKQGFVTLEIQEHGERTGFSIVTARGTRAVLASIHSDSLLRVSKYGVDINNLESLLPELQTFTTNDVLYIDEIGRMELYSDAFQRLVKQYLDADNVFIGTLTQVYSNSFTNDLRSRSDVEIIQLTPENRNDILQQLKTIL